MLYVIFHIKLSRERFNQKEKDTYISIFFKKIWKNYFVPSPAAVAHQTELTSQNTTDTMIHANKIIINQIQACFKIVNHFLYLPSSPAAVTIWTPSIFFSNSLDSLNTCISL